MNGHNAELVQLLNVLAFPTDQTTYAQADSTLQAGLKQPGKASLFWQKRARICV
jgi:hypothetical protein